MKIIRSIALGLSILFSTSSVTIANVVSTAHVDAQLISKTLSVQPGQPLDLALKLNIKPHWHTYWQYPGDSGLPTRLTWTLPTGFTASEIRWPQPMRLPVAPLMNFGYEGEVLHLVRIAVPANFDTTKPLTFAAKANWLVCSDVCIPESVNLTLTLPVTLQQPQTDKKWQTQFAHAEAMLPKANIGGHLEASSDSNTLTINFTPAQQDGKLQGLEFFPDAAGKINNASAQKFSSSTTGYQLLIEADKDNARNNNISGVLVATKADNTAQSFIVKTPINITTTAANTAPAPSDITFWSALLFAFIGGLILNLMPCVFPVLSIKVMRFVQHAQAGQNGQTPARAQGLAFFAGVMLSFLSLAALLLILRAQGEALGWGFQLQSPGFVGALAGLFLLMALNLWGVFEFGFALQSAAGNIAAHKSALGEAFLAGVLATIVATPCTAPFLGAALGYTLSQPAPIALTVFAAIGLGMALPVVLLSFFPQWLRYLPKPGAWMDTFKQLMAFPLAATVAWLLWVWGGQLGNDALLKLLLGLVVLALAAWCYGRWQFSKPRLGAALGAGFMLIALYVAWPQTQNDNDEWLPYSAEKVSELRAQGTPVFIDFTANWCISCQVNERVALRSDEVRTAFKASGVALVKADWTRQDAAITAALAEHNRNGVPLYVFYPADGGAARVLPEILTPGIVLSALR